jgi:hypothetical protein
MKVWMLTLLMFPLSAFAGEFSHIKLNPDFERYLTQPQTKSNLAGALTRKSFALSASDAGITSQNNIQSKMASVLLGAAFGAKTGGITTPIPVDGEESLLYEEIRRHLEAAHGPIGLDQVQHINRLNQQFNLGTSNFSGFSWQRPFGVVQVYVDRQVTPNIFGTNWLVMDTFTFEVEATTFLEKLNEAGMSGMSATEIGAFAGITFRRVYTYWHYANSYQDGLQADFSRLFLPFVKFNQSGMEKMGHEEILKREDVWTASAGGIITTPPLYNVSFSGGVLTQYDFQNVTTIQSNHTQDQNAERYKVGVLSKKEVNAGVSLELQLDFFKLIKFSLLRYDMNYEYASGKEYTLGLNSNQWNHVKNDNEESAEFKSILKGFGTVKKLEPYIVRLDETSSEAVEQRGSVLIWGKMQKSKTEQVRVIKDNAVRVFFKNYSQNVKVVQNLLSRIFSAIVYKLLKFPIGTSNASIYSRQLTMEYEATHAQATDPKITRLDSTEQFSFVLTQYYNAARTDRWIDKRFKNDVIWFVDNFTTLPKTYKTDIRNEVLKGPLLVESNLRVEKAGLHFLLDSSEDSVFGQLAKICGSKKTQEWMQQSSRRELLEDRHIGAEACVKEIGLKYQGFKYDYVANHLKPSLTKFKEFITKYYKQSERIADLQAIFGPQNTFIHGKLQGKVSNGANFNTAFSTGQFRGLGVIDNFKRSVGSRVPASIVSE